MNETKRSKVRVVGQVPLIDGLQIPYHRFRDQFMLPNLPVLISGLMHQWRAFSTWSSPSGAPDLDYLASHFGNSNVQVAECSTREFTDQKRVNMTVADYIAYWKLHNLNKQELGGTNSLLYLKDWHFVKEFPDYGSYSTPTFFMDDWLNFYLEHHQLHAQVDPAELSDYRFVYMGPKGTWTPLHADVFRSYSWSGNVCGKKLWHLLPPSETHLIFDRHTRSSVYNIYGDVSVEEFPNFYKAGWLECAQERGQIIFVPSGWYHQVTNLEDTISINHNWFNGYNLHWVWELILTDYEETKASIEDIRLIADNFEELCQRNLAANSGMNFHDLFVFLKRMMVFFLSILHHISSRDKEEKNKTRTLLTSSDIRSVCSDISTQVLFNLQSIGSVAQLMASIDTYVEGLLASPKALHMRRNGEWNVDDGNEMESGVLACWVDNAQNSEYKLFLTKLMSPCTCPDMSGACLCANPVEHRFVLQGNTPNLTFDTVEISSIIDIETKVKMPNVLVQVIGVVIDLFKQAYQVKF